MFTVYSVSNSKTPPSKALIKFYNKNQFPLNRYEHDGLWLCGDGGRAVKGKLSSLFSQSMASDLRCVGESWRLEGLMLCPGTLLCKQPSPNLIVFIFVRSRQKRILYLGTFQSPYTMMFTSIPKLNPASYYFSDISMVNIWVH